MKRSLNIFLPYRSLHALITNRQPSKASSIRAVKRQTMQSSSYTCARTRSRDIYMGLASFPGLGMRLLWDMLRELYTLPLSACSSTKLELSPPPPPPAKYRMSKLRAGLQLNPLQLTHYIHVYLCSYIHVTSSQSLAL